jgi:hypothetical protein
MLGVLRAAKMHPEAELTSLAELGFPGEAPDEQWMSDLGNRGGHIVITRDGNILNAALRRSAWEASGLGLIILDKQWAMLPIREWARHMLYWWPHATRRALDGEPGSAWTVKPRISEPPAEWIRRVTAGRPK